MNNNPPPSNIEYVNKDVNPPPTQSWHFFYTNPTGQRVEIRLLEQVFLDVQRLDTNEVIRLHRSQIISEYK